jgi:predicted HAD superfamily phosphohydrolase YqeG
MEFNPTSKNLKKPMNHIFYSIRMIPQRWKELAMIYNQAVPNQRAIDIAPKDLIKNNITVLALDFDGVLSHHGYDRPLPEVEDWIKECILHFGAENIFIVSNKPSKDRIDYFQKHFPETHFISGVPKKPYPDGLNKVCRISGVPTEQITLFDDRLFTGALAGCLAGVRVIYITKPYVQLSYHPVRELCFIFLRWLERMIVGYLYSSHMKTEQTIKPR